MGVIPLTNGIKLKHCPFCGKMPVIWRTTYSERYRVRCVKGCGAETDSFPNKDKAIEFWNRRKNE